MNMVGFTFCTFFALSVILRCISAQGTQAPQNWANNEEIKIFREYLRIPTISTPTVDYKPAVEFLKRQAASLNLTVSIFYPVNQQNPVVLMTWKGSQLDLPSIMLNSHMDVVPVFEEFWTHPPFAADIDQNGDIYARGSQDMKSIGMQYLGAIRALKRQGINQLKRTVYITFVPDEENGGLNGMAGFVQSSAFKAMKVGFELDEGSPELSENNKLFAYFGQKTARTAKFVIHGQTGHGSRYFDNSPGEKLTKLLNIVKDFREVEMRKLNELKYPAANVTVINLTILKGGVANNVVPAEMNVTFDIRVSINADLNKFEQQLDCWCERAGGNITIEYIARAPKEPLTKVDNSNPYWVAFKSAIDSMRLPVEPGVASGGTDAKYLRRLNIPAINFSPLFNTTLKAHDNNEYINAQVFLNGIEIYKTIISSVANV